MDSRSPLDLARRAEEAARDAADAIRDADSVAPCDAVALYETFDRVVRVASAAKLLLAKRVDASGEAHRRGLRNTAELLASVAGTSLGAAKGELEASDALSDLPTTATALLEGRVSAEQGKIVAGAAKVNPAAEQRLLSKAKTANQQELRNEAQKAKAAADPDPEATHRRIHRGRRVSTFTDSDGAWNLRGNGTVVDGSVIVSELERLTDEIFRARGKAGTSECRDAYQFDALKQMAERSRRLHTGSESDGSPRAKPRRQANPQHLALLRLDLEALWRGHVEGEELCEITGLGPIPRAAAKALLGDAVLKLIITKGVDVLNVTSLTRRRTQAMHYASLWTSPTCLVEGCSRTRIEYDHRTGAEWKATQHTRLDELDPLCGGHHELHTSKGWALVEGTGKRPMVPPEDPRHPLNRGPTTCDPPPTDGDPSALSALSQSIRDAVVARRAAVQATCPAALRPSTLFAP